MSTRKEKILSKIQDLKALYEEIYKKYKKEQTLSANYDDISNNNKTLKQMIKLDNKIYCLYTSLIKII